MDLTCRDLYAECLFRITSVHWQTIHRNEGSFGEQVIPNVTGCGLFPLRRSYVAIVSSMVWTLSLARDRLSRDDCTITMTNAITARAGGV